MQWCHLAVGSKGVGVRDGDVVRDAGSIASNIAAALTDGRLARLSRTELSALPAIPLSNARFRPLATERVFCVGRNYREHAAEMDGSVPPPAFPQIFTRFPTSLVAHGELLRHPGAVHEYDYEGELAIVIGSEAAHVAEHDALEHVAGYSVFFDGSVRDLQKHSLFAGKNCTRSGASGPWFVSNDEVGDAQSLQLTTRINGEVRQSANTAAMIFTIPYIVAYLSRVLTLQPGDVIATGTPAGVAAGRKPSPWLQSGDAIDITIERVGALSVRIG
jgi:2-keto-4-pentenoate hydratase/2-oxohepta-3-ene-1,7-dioic acid hydratase in catechol pathway